MSAVEVLGAGAKDASGTGSAVDVSAHACLRLDVNATADLGQQPQLVVTLETGPTSSGPWTELASQRLIASAHPSDPHAWRPLRWIVTPDNFVRARWAGHSSAAGGVRGEGASVPGLDIEISGEGVPDAP